MQNFLYDAFISYRHTPQDTKTAETIQYELEHFRVPKGVRSTYGIKKIDRIFRDQAELQMSSDLSREIEKALDASRFLIVICSEAYNQSPWCLHEVEYFLKHHNPERVLCVLSQGEPPGIFPAQLRAQKYPVRNPDGSVSYLTVGSEPLACDFRNDTKRSRRIEIPRLAAKIIGCSYDELVMRHEHYRRRRLAAILAASGAAALLAMSYLAWSNIQIRRNFRQSQINESRTLARESIAAYEDQDRLTALQLALEALPSRGSNRPVTDDALNALIKASYAYEAPREALTEYWRIDLPNDITACFISSDDAYVVCMDKAGQFFVYDLKTHEQICMFLLPHSGIPNAIEEFKDHSLLACADGITYCIDYLTGETRWSCSMMYSSSVGAAHASHDGRYIATANSFAIPITDDMGEPYSALLLPDSVPGYIIDAAWSTNDRYLAVEIRTDTEQLQIGLFDCETADFVLLPESYSAILGWFFDNEDHLYIFGNTEASPSSFIGDDTYYHKEGIYKLTAYNWKKRLFQREFISSELPEHIHMYASITLDQIAVMAGTDLSLLDLSGKLIREYDIVVPARGLILYSEDNLSMISDDGTLILLNLSDGSLVLRDQFPPGITNAWGIPAQNGLSYAFAIGGDLSFYDYLYDEKIEYYDNVILGTIPDDICYGKNTIVLQYDRTLRFVNRQTRAQVNTLELDQGDVYHIIDQIDEIMYVLHVNAKTGKLSVLSYDLDSTAFMEETPLDLYDPFISLGKLTYPLDREYAVYIASIYQAPSFMSQNGQLLYFHDLNDDGRILTYDLITHEEKTLHVQLEEGYSLVSNTTLLPSPLFPSPTNDCLFTLQTKATEGPDGETTYETTGVLIDLSSGAVTPVSQNVLFTSLSGGIAAWNGNEILVVERSTITAYSKKGEALYEIPLSGNSVLALACHNGKSYCIYQNGHMQVCKKDKILRDVTLEVPDASYLTDKSFRFLFADQMLYLSHTNYIDAVNLDSDSTKPVYSLGSNIIQFLPDTSELLVYANSPVINDSSHYLASFTEYSTDALIRRAQEQLDQY